MPKNPHVQMSYGIFSGSKFWHHRQKASALKFMRQQDTICELREMPLSLYKKLQADAERQKPQHSTIPAKVSATIFYANSTPVQL